MLSLRQNLQILKIIVRCLPSNQGVLTTRAASLCRYMAFLTDEENLTTVTAELVSQAISTVDNTTNVSYFLDNTYCNVK